MVMPESRLSVMEQVLTIKERDGAFDRRFNHCYWGKK
jgi:hypothetical protein